MYTKGEKNQAVSKMRNSRTERSLQKVITKKTKVETNEIAN